MNKRVKFWLTAGLITVITGTGTAAMAADSAPTFIKKLNAPLIKAKEMATTQADGTTTAPQDHMVRGGHHGGGLMIMGDELFTLLKLTQDEFRTQTEAGKTLLQIATAQGVTEQQLTDFLTKQHTAHIDQAVTDGKLTQEQADAMKANFPEHIKNMINHTHPVGMGGPGGHGKGGMGFGGMKIGDELFTLLNITKEQFQTECQAGKTLLEIATAHNVTEQQLTDFFTEQHTAKMEQAVKDGKMTQEQADQLKANLPTMISKIINSKPGDHKIGKGMGKVKGMKMKGFHGGDQTKPAQPAQPTDQTQTVTPASTL